MQGSETVFDRNKDRLQLLARFFMPIITLLYQLIRGIPFAFPTKGSKLSLLKVHAYSRLGSLPNGQQNAYRFDPPRRNTGGSH